MLRVVGIDDLATLAAMLQLAADKYGKPWLIVARSRPGIEGSGTVAYGVPEEDADAWEKANHSRRIVPAQEVRDDVDSQAGVAVDGK